VSGLTGVTDAALADDPAGRARLWAWRELHTDAINRLGAPIKLDVALPPAHLAEFLDRAGPTVRSAGSLPRDQGLPADQVAAGPDEIRLWVFGHIGEGCLHLNVTGAGPAAGHVQAQEIEDAVFGLVAELGGSISAEHGIGTAKLPWLHLARTPAELEAFRSIKTALDPAGILNPNALIPRR
jgi:FAD/FMN-containing dehydrogenase